MEARTLKDKLTIENIKDIMRDLGATESPNSTLEYTIYQTGTHHLNWDEGSFKLYLYHSTKSFFSYTEATSYDIIGVVEARWQLEGRDYTFADVLNYIAHISGLSDEDISTPTTHCSWRSLTKYLRREHKTYNGREFEHEVFEILPPYKHNLFLNDGISAQTMDKFSVGWYPPKAQITIPVFDCDGALKGIHARNTIQSIVDKGFKYIPLKTTTDDYRFKTGSVLYGINVNKPYIEKTKSVTIFEAPKSVLQMDTMYGESNAVALFGTNLSEAQRNMILQMGVEEVNLAFDKQYQECSGDEWDRYVRLIQKTAKMFKGYCRVYSLTDMGELLGYKDSPSDRGKDVYEEILGKKFMC